MMETREIGWVRRISGAAFTLAINAVVWVLIPNFLSGAIASYVPATSFTSTLVITFGIVITALQTLGSLTKGMAISIPFNSASYIASAYYIYVAADKGNLALSYSGIQIQIAFPLLLFLLMLPSLFNTVRIPITYLLEESEAGKEAKALP